MPQTSKQQPSLLRLECFKRAPVLAHGVLYTSLPTTRACGRLESTLPPALATVGWAAGAVRLAAAATLATRAHLASVCSILHNGPPARTRVRPSLLDLCHGTGRSSHAAAPAIVLGAYLSTHRARRVACHKPASSSLRCCDSMLQTRTCARARRALQEPPDRTSVWAARIHPSPALATVGWAVGAVRLAAAATLAT